MKKVLCLLLFVCILFGTASALHSASITLEKETIYASGHVLYPPPADNPNSIGTNL